MANVFLESYDRAPKQIVLDIVISRCTSSAESTCCAHVRGSQSRRESAMFKTFPVYRWHELNREPPPVLAEAVVAILLRVSPDSDGYPSLLES
jgi:hypothetical protein